MKGAFDFRSFRKGFAAAAGLGALAAVGCLAAEPAAASTYKILHSFGASEENGLTPLSALMDAKGKLYGATAYGGGGSGPNSWCPGYGCGVEFELSPPATTGGAWTETVLHSFGASSMDTANPQSAVIMDTKGNLYGTTAGVGSLVASAFELSPPAKTGGAWTETVLYSFGGSSITDPFGPLSALIRDDKGNLYGNAANGGAYGSGVAFELSPPAATGGKWTLTVLHSFGASSTDGHFPEGTLIKDDKGNLYGTTLVGGAYGSGAAFELSPPATTGGKWTETVLHSFRVGSTDGQYPQTAGLIMDAKGKLYGTTDQGGAYVYGTVFELSPPATTGGKWTETLLHSFSGADGQYPVAALIMDAKGNLCGTTALGGGRGFGVVFELSPPAKTGGAWTDKTLHSFGASSTDGQTPQAALIMDAEGNLYGTTGSGGAYGPPPATAQCSN